MILRRHGVLDHLRSLFALVAAKASSLTKTISDADVTSWFRQEVRERRVGQDELSLRPTLAFGGNARIAQRRRLVARSPVRGNGQNLSWQAGRGTKPAGQPRENARMPLSRRLVSIAALAFAVIAIAPSSKAETLVGVNIPDKATVAGKSLKLNGVGLRTATMLKIKVYVIGLYLENTSTDAKSIIASTETKRIEMEFVRGVDAGKIRDGWSEAFQHNYPNVAAIQKEIDTFNASMQDMREGDQIVLDFDGDELELSVKGAVAATISGNDFQQAVLSIWLGPKPPNEDLKQGLLGQH